MRSFFEFLVSDINHYHIDRLHLFWDSFEWFCLQISSDAKYFFSLVQGIGMEDLWLLFNAQFIDKKYLKEKIFKQVLTAKTKHILFNEPAVCIRGTK